MKKFFIISGITIVAFAGCKKKENSESIIVTASAPTVTVTGPLTYDISVGGALPDIQATAYDSFYKTSVPVKIDNSTLDANTPGLYTVNVTATNKYGYIGTSPVLVAVSNRSATEDISGIYIRTNGIATNVSKVGNGFYYIDNVGGVDSLSDQSSNIFVVPAYFVITSDTTIDLGQQDSGGPLSAAYTKLSLAPADTFFEYKLTSGLFNPNTVRHFDKQ